MFQTPTDGDNGHRALKTNKRVCLFHHIFMEPGLQRISTYSAARGLKEPCGPCRGSTRQIRRKGIWALQAARPKVRPPLNNKALDSRFLADFLIFEHLYSQQFKKFKVGVIYCKGGQTDPHQMLSNGLCMSPQANVYSAVPAETLPASASFWTFMQVMGNKIDLSNWGGYRGDMDKGGVTFFEKWKQLEGTGVGFPT